MQIHRLPSLKGSSLVLAGPLCAVSGADTAGARTMFRTKVRRMNSSLFFWKSFGLVRAEVSDQHEIAAGPGPAALDEKERLAIR
jgi:hypothetical protein